METPVHHALRDNLTPTSRGGHPMQLPSAAKTVAYVASLLLAGYGGFAGHAAIAPHVASPAPVAAPEVLAPPPAPVQVEPVLEQVPIPSPPVVTGLPYPKTCHVQGQLPDPTCTPGSVNPAVTQDNIASTICKTGWTATVRPPLASTAPVKTAAMKAYGVPASARGTVELDHDVPLELAGSDDTSNLWPQLSDIPNDGVFNHKDRIETTLKAAVCAHKVTPAFPHGITLIAAQVAIATNWTTAEHVLGLK